MPDVYEGDRPFIFVSYAHADGAAMPIIRALAEEGYRVWYDDGIQAGSSFPAYIADHIHDCSCVLMLVSRSSLTSVWCRSEVEYALDLVRPVLPVYLEKVELPRALQMRLGSVQALYWHKYATDEEFNAQLFSERLLDPCLTPEGRLRGGVKPKGGGPNEGGSGAVGTQGAGYAAEPEGTRDERSDRLDEGLSRQAAPSAGPDLDVSPQSARSRYVSPPRNDVHVTSSGEYVVRTGSETRELRRALEISKRSKLADYSWDELKELSQAIAAAGSDEEGLGIAKAYGLVDKDGKLRGDVKEVVLGDKGKTKAHVRILGFRHDELAGGGRAGISFEFADVPVRHRMNVYRTNAGGWEGSEMRKWLNDEGGFLGLLPSDLRSNVAEARKRTNNRGKVEENDTACVTATDDRLWLLSACEAYGSGPYWHAPDIYAAEGVQYGLFAGKDVTVENHGFCVKGGVGPWWWLRSPCTYDSIGFRVVYNTDGNYSLDSRVAWGVSPGFCL